jgi:succinoglycan biosynthesis transport protein ExoP
MSQDDRNKLVPAERPVDAPGALTRMPERSFGYGYGSGYGYAGARDDSGDFNIREYLRVINKNKWIILTLVVVVTTLVAIAAYRVQDVYQTSAIIQVADDAPNLLPGSQPVVVYDYGGKRFNTQLLLLQTPDLIRKVVVETDLEHNPAFFSTKPTTLSAAFTSIFKPAPEAPAVTQTTATLAPVRDPNAPLDEETTRRLAPYVGSVIGGLSVNEIKDTQLIAISFRHHNPEIAAKVVNSVAQNFIDNDLNRRVDSKASTSGYLRERIADLQSQIRAGEERLLNYGKSHEIMSFDDEAQNTVVQRLTSLNEDLLKAESERRELEAVRDALKETGGTDDFMRIATVQKDQGAAEISRRLSELRNRLSELSQKYTDEWPEVKAVKEQIAEAEAEMERVKVRVLASFEGQYQAALKKEATLRQDFETQRGETMQQNEASISARIIQQEVETNKKLLETLLQRSKEVDISAASERTPIVLKNRAEIPGGPAGPDRQRWILMAFAGALFCGVALAFGREYLDQTIRSVEDVDRVVRLPSLGVIPALSSGGKKRARKMLSAGGNGNGNSAQNTSALITALEAKSSAAEAYRQLRTSVLLSSAGHPSKLLLVTSSQPREGKTTTAVNTAISLAQTGASTIIVDCDMRKPRVHQLLNASNHVGVSLYLSGQNEDLGTLVQPHQIPNLSVLPCGPVPPNPAELLGSEQMRKLLAELSLQYDHVVIDTPPVIAFADAVILSTMVDGVILVVRGGYSSKGIVLRSRQLLADVGAKIYGVVLNDADMKSSDSYHYYSAHYSSYYGKEEPGRDA